MRLQITLLICCLIAVPLAAQYEVSVTTIHVWVKATDARGDALGLQQGDFEIFEDGKKMNSTCFEELSFAPPAPVPAAAPAPQPAPAEKRKVAIFLDLYNTSPRELAAIKPPLKSFLDSLKNQPVEVMIVALLHDRKLGIVAKFGQDMERLKSLIDQAKGNARRDNVLEEGMKAVKEAATSENPGSKHDDTEDRLHDAYLTASVTAANEEESSVFTLRAFESFAYYISQYHPGDHISILLISGGFSTDPTRRYMKIVEPLETRAGLEVPNRPDDRRLDVKKSNVQLVEELKKSIGRFNRLNVTLYTISTRGPSAEADVQDSLIQIARETGGLPFYNSDNFLKGLADAYQDLDHQYLLCYTMPQHDRIGEYHQIKVTSKRSGLNLRYRQGYLD